jgi:hypothetical protein
MVIDLKKKTPMVIAMCDYSVRGRLGLGRATLTLDRGHVLMEHASTVFGYAPCDAQCRPIMGAARVQAFLVGC